MQVDLARLYALLVVRCAVRGAIASIRLAVENTLPWMM